MGEYAWWLIQSVLCDEVFASEYDRLDEIFYYTMLNIKDRLEKTVEVYNPTDPVISLLSAQNHYDKMNNWLSRLSNKLEKLSVWRMMIAHIKKLWQHGRNFLNIIFGQN